MARFDAILFNRCVVKDDEIDLLNVAFEQKDKRLRQCDVRKPHESDGRFLLERYEN